MFTTVASVDAVPYVGGAALLQLEAYANAHPAPAGDVVETVAFRGWEIEAIVWGVNRASVHELDVDVALDARAAQNLVGKAPFATLGSIAAIAQVGPAALTALRAHAPVWWARMHAAPRPCDLAFDVIADASADDLNRLIDAATTLDYPAYELVTLQIDPCVLADATQRARVVPALRQLPRDVVHWAIDPAIPPSATELAPGTTEYVAWVGEVADTIHERAEGGWTPADAAEQALYDHLPQLIDALTSAPRANPAGYLQSILHTDAEECSEHAAALVNPSNGRISILHSFPRC
jgi:hypothetical protein